jgi:hypothetical protein
MNVRAKFQVKSVTNHLAGNTQVHLEAIHGADNRAWSKATPSGSLQMNITNEGAASQFKLGSFVFLDFSDAPEKETEETK